MLIACLYIDCDLLPVVISWDTLPVSDRANWIFASQPLLGGTGSMDTGVMASSLASESEENSVGTSVKEGILPDTLRRQL